jgi:hypothetical protein
VATPIDPGATAILWHILRGATLISALHWRRLASWIEVRWSLPPQQARGFVFAAFFAWITVPLTINLVQGQPMPRFNDIFLAGIVLTCYLFAWQPAAFLLGVSVLVSAWILPPYGSLEVRGFTEWFRLSSFTLLSTLLIVLIARMKARSKPLPRRAMSASAAAGD